MTLHPCFQPASPQLPIPTPLHVAIGSRRNDDWAVSRAADCTLLVPEIDAEFDKGCQQSRRLHPDDNEDGEGGGDKGSLAEPPTAPFTIRTLPFVDDWLHSNDAEGEGDDVH